MTDPGRFPDGRLNAARRASSRAWAPFDAVRKELGRSGTMLSSLLVFPGLTTRLGLRYIIGRLLGTRVAHARLSYEFGGILQTSPVPSARRNAMILLLPSVLLVLTGIAFGLPILLEMRLLGVNLIPGAVSADGTTELVLKRFLVRGTTDGFGLWVAISAWYAAALTRSELKQVLAGLETREDRRFTTKVLLIVLAPLRALTRVTDPLDRFGLAAGAVSLVIWLLVTGAGAWLLF